MLKHLVYLFLSFCALSSAAHAADRYIFDKDHTHIIFFVSHIGFSDTIGRIREFDGYFTFDEKEPEKSAIDVTLNPASVATDVAALDKILLSDKFFNIEKFPSIQFKSSQVLVTGKQMGDVIGNLTLLGVTRPVVLHIKYNKSGIHPFTNNYVSGFSADADLKRSDFGMNAYIPDVGDNVHVHIEAEGIDPLKHPGNSKAPH